MKSIVDYLKGTGADSSYAARKKLALEYGIQNYTGTAKQNTTLLNSLQNKGMTNASAPNIGTPFSIAKESMPKPAVPVPNPKDYTTYTYRQSQSSTPAYQPSEDVNAYKKKLSRIERNKPDAFESRYTSQIDSILDGIMNRKKFDITSDGNYANLYQTMKENYMNAGNKAMRDTMGQAAALSGGYGSSYAQTVGSQAYDNYMQQLNARNENLMQLAYGMYQDETADNYNRLNAVMNLDNTDYGRYRDEVGDYYNDLNYYAGRYNSEYANDYGRYADRLAQNNLETEFNYRQAQDALAQKNYEDEVAYQRQQDALALAMAKSGGGSSGRRGSGKKAAAKSSKTEEVKTAVKEEYSGNDWQSYAGRLARTLSKNRITNEKTSADKEKNDLANYKAAEDIVSHVDEGWFTPYEMDLIIRDSGVDWERAKRYRENNSSLESEKPVNVWQRKWKR